MDVGGKGWRVKAFSSGSVSNDATIISRVMLRFRPIAPKPVTGDSSGGERGLGIKNGLVGKGRIKRKYVRVKKNNGLFKRTKKTTSSDQVQKVSNEDGLKKEFLTLQLLPEKNDLAKEGSRSWSGSATVVDYPRVVKIDNNLTQEGTKDKTAPHNANNRLVEGVCGSDLAGVAAEKRMLGTWVTVETVTDTCMDATVGGLGCTDVERMKNLEGDTCPGFTSDGLNRVQWVNQAYKKLVMVGQKEEGGLLSSTENIGVGVGLVIREELLPYFYSSSAFTCWVKLQYAWQKDKCSQTMMVPCDVWRMDCGGFAWRLDVKAALSLGL
ncbi:hypothetical protein Tsubulata_043418 [Turnera subulata]|uniref:DUF7950 domain-containing protein n=1 Tax=Turnera subulata TaxID=218843 RepID=A0A9Q0EZT8_9ROSI|nr:hypothetical protein Tsubulata_043418 [Turnera subulata]